MGLFLGALALAVLLNTTLAQKYPVLKVKRFQRKIQRNPVIQGFDPLDTGVGKQAPDAPE